MEQFHVGVVGAGHVGLVTGVCLAHLGHRVVCVDRDEERISALREGRIPFYKPGLKDLVASEVQEERLSFASSDDLPEVVSYSDVSFIAVNTPRGYGGSADLASVGEVARSVGRALTEAKRKSPLIVVNKSTVPVGSGDYVSMLIRDGAEENGGGSLISWSSPTPSSLGRVASSTTFCFQIG